jgi:hypothetical protein
MLQHELLAARFHVSLAALILILLYTFCFSIWMALRINFSIKADGSPQSGIVVSNTHRAKRLVTRPSSRQPSALRSNPSMASFGSCALRGFLSSIQSVSLICYSTYP